MGRISRLPLLILNARSTTHKPWYCSMTSLAGRSVLVTYPFKPSHRSSSAIFSWLMDTSTSLLISRNLLYPRLLTFAFVSMPDLYDFLSLSTPLYLFPASLAALLEE